MKNIIKSILLLFLITIAFACEDVVDIPLENSNPKLVIDANLTWQKGTSGTTQTIRLTLTNDFYTNEIKVASGAVVTITDSDNNLFTFNQVSNTAEYVCNNFVPVLNKDYTLKVKYQGQEYIATNKLLASPSFDPFINQIKIPGFGSKEIIKVELFFKDDATEENYYLLSAKNPRLKITEYLPLEDRFTQGNLLAAPYINDKTEQNDTFKFSLQAITKSQFNYIKKILSVSGQNSGGPFATPPATIRGNIINQSNNDNYPFGYFSLAEIDKVEYTVK